MHGERSLVMEGPDMIADVKQFMLAMGQECPSVPAWPSFEIRVMRMRLIKEEYYELVKAEFCDDFVETVDGILDEIYVLIGKLISMGVDPGPVWREVQRSNMAKLGGEIRQDGKVMKPKDWVGPDIAGCLKVQGWKDEQS